MPELAHPLRALLLPGRSGGAAWRPADGAGPIDDAQDRGPERRAVRFRGHRPTGAAALTLPNLFMRGIGSLRRMPPPARGKAGFAAPFSQRFVRAQA